jgi:ABC-type uncharacterized transport system substrate-binding protein
MLTLGGVATWPVAMSAQQVHGVRYLGVLSFAEPDAEATRFQRMQQELQKLGWVTGHNLQIDYRYAGLDLGQLRAFALELVGRSPNVLVAEGTQALSNGIDAVISALRATLHANCYFSPTQFAAKFGPLEPDR